MTTKCVFAVYSLSKRIPVHWARHARARAHVKNLLSAAHGLSSLLVAGFIYYYSSDTNEKFYSIAPFTHTRARA